MAKDYSLKRESGWKQYSHKQVFTFCEDYKQFIAASKTERLCVQQIIAHLTKAGFSESKGNKRYMVLHDKVVIAYIVGKDPTSLRLIGSHVDSPRLDLKPNPVYEDANVALFKTHYYGGVKKYHWVNTPLSLHGVIFTQKGKAVPIALGDAPDDPRFIISDLLPHLARSQMERKADKIIEGEELNILVGNIPVTDAKIKEQFKCALLAHLYKTYGIIEEDFNCAELELVPAQNPMDIGFDRSLIAAYGQDDKVCVYTSLQALLAISQPKHTAVALFVDKEEIGSMGNTGAASFLLDQFARKYVEYHKLTVHPRALLEQSKSISADVTAAQDPNFKDVHDAQNVPYLGRGVAIEKYGGGGGKYSTNDAHAEYMAYLRGIMQKHKVAWQAGELGKVDMGGGGTIAMFLSRYGMDCVDAGPAVLGMHSPCEVASKVDIYAAYLLYKAFFMD